MHAELAALLRDALELELAPVAIAFLDAPPDGIDRVDTTMPAGCGFWRLARERVFYTEAADHTGCPIGVLTMGLEAAPDVQQRAGELVTLMESIDYLHPGEVASLPSVRPGPAVIAYGPLERFPLEPDVVLVTSTPEQAMWLAEAAGAMKLNEPALHLHGRPACAAIPACARVDPPRALARVCGHAHVHRGRAGDADERVARAGPRRVWASVSGRPPPPTQSMRAHYAGMLE